MIDLTQSAPAGPKNDDIDEVPGLPESLVSDPQSTNHVAWDLYPYTAAGHLTVLTGQPLVGKTTFATQYAFEKARGGTFLGHSLKKAPVVWIGPNELHHDQLRRFAALGELNPEIHMWDSFDLFDDHVSLEWPDPSLVVVQTKGTQKDESWLKYLRGTANRSCAAWLVLYAKDNRLTGYGDDAGSIFCAEAEIVVLLHPVLVPQYKRTLRILETPYDSVPAKAWSLR